MTEHVVTRVNDGWYICECGDTGSERWANLHQFPMVDRRDCRVDVLERAVHPGHPGYLCSVTVTHVPSGLVETCAESKSALQNERVARTRLAARAAAGLGKPQ